METEIASHCSVWHNSDVCTQKVQLGLNSQTAGYQSGILEQHIEVIRAHSPRVPPQEIIALEIVLRPSIRIYVHTCEMLSKSFSVLENIDEVTHILSDLITYYSQNTPIELK